MDCIVYALYTFVFGSLSHKLKKKTDIHTHISTKNRTHFDCWFVLMVSFAAVTVTMAMMVVVTERNVSPLFSLLHVFSQLTIHGLRSVVRRPFPKQCQTYIIV